MHLSQTSVELRCEKQGSLYIISQRHRTAVSACFGKLGILLDFDTKSVQSQYILRHNLCRAHEEMRRDSV